MPILPSVDLVGRGAAIKAADVTGIQAPTISPGQFVLRDTFNDDLTGTMWGVLADDPNNCMVKEVGQRLELQATDHAANASAGYVSAGWRLDPTYDFAMRVDYHYDLRSFAEGWLSLGVTQEATDPWAQNAVIGVGCAHAYANYWYRIQTGYTIHTNSAQRPLANGSLYISYDAGADELYLGLADYGAEDAWATLYRLRTEQWGNRPIFIWLAGGSDGLAVPSGRVYLDNFLVQKGTLIEASPKDVYRFWSPVLGRHFYTISDAEKETLVTQFNDIWTYEGVAYRAFAENSDPDTKPVYRFWSDYLSGHFYTISETEKDWLIVQDPQVWTFEGVAFYVYPSGRQPPGALPVYSFWSPNKSAQFYTISEEERNNLIVSYPNVWTDEGIAWYAPE